MLPKNLILIPIVIAITALTTSISFQTSGSIKGMVSPPNGAARVWAISKTDTISCIVYKGEFIITELPAGTYTLIVEAIPPYKNQRREFVIVRQNQQTDIGYISLRK
jgi:hypothetical protein